MPTPPEVDTIDLATKDTGGTVVGTSGLLPPTDAGGDKTTGVSSHGDTPISNGSGSVIFTEHTSNM